MKNLIEKWLNKNTKEVSWEANTYTPKKFICVSSSADHGKGLSFNEKAEHIFNLIKKK